MFSMHGPFTNFGTAWVSSSVCGASTKAMSAPASMAALARRIASSKPRTARESVGARSRKTRETLGHMSPERHDRLVLKMAALLGEALVLDMDSGDPALLVLAPGADRVQLV